MFQSISTFLHRRTGRRLRLTERIAPEEVAGEAVNLAISVVGKILVDPEWKKYVDPLGEKNAEEARIFQELVGACLLMVYTSLDETIPFLPGERRVFWRQVRDAFFPTYLKQLSEDPNDNQTHWQKFFDFLLGEYDYAQKETYNNFRSKLSLLRTDEDRQASIRVMSLSALCMSRVANGQATADDTASVRCLQKHFDFLGKENWRRFGW